MYIVKHWQWKTLVNLANWILFVIFSFLKSYVILCNRCDDLHNCCCWLLKLFLIQIPHWVKIIPSETIEFANERTNIWSLSWNFTTKFLEYHCDFQCLLIAAWPLYVIAVACLTLFVIIFANVLPIYF